MSETPTEIDAGQLIYDRFEIVRELGSGGQATTWLARDLATETDVALKELSLERVVDWKAVELFEREGQALASIDHPQVPDYIDAFHVEGDGERSRFFLAQEYVTGDSLLQLLEEGERMGLERASELLEDLLSVLAYLHDRTPPIIHRDIKPSNILIDDDGRVVLVDFGAVQTVLPNTMGGSTIVGTTGFFPMEQLMGRAVPASDLYAVGATMVRVMTGHHPADLDMERNRLQFEHLMHAPEWFISFLRRLLEPAAEDRFDDAGAARAFFKKLRARGEASVDDESRGELREAPDWLEASSKRVLVEDRATKQDVYRLECSNGTTLEDDIERTPGEVELVVQADKAVVHFTTGPARTTVTAGGFAALLALAILLAFPLPVYFRLTIFALGGVGFLSYFQWRRSPAKREVSIFDDRIEIVTDGSTQNLRYPRQSRFEESGEDVLLVSENEDRVMVAGGLGEERARWLASTLERVRSRLADSEQIVLDGLETSADDEQHEVVEVGVGRSGDQ